MGYCVILWLLGHLQNVLKIILFRKGPNNAFKIVGSLNNFTAVHT